MRSSRQLWPTSGRTTGMVSTGPSITATIIPLVVTIAPCAIRCGSQSRTSVGSDGCMTAMPKPISTVAR